MSDTNVDTSWPAGEATLLCPCGFETSPFCFDEILYRCESCCTVDRPLPVPFLFKTPNCTSCGRTFAINERISASNMRPCYLNSTELENEHVDLTVCPQCTAKSMGLNSLGVQYMKGETNCVVPDAGQTIHTLLYRSGKDYFLSSPRLSSCFITSYSIQDTSAKKLGNGYHEFVVLDVDELKPWLHLQYIRRIPADELL
ncbi:hypothetical protein Poly51_49140 [Rubripirellula tenax]|uniref:Uncharacterized protein n=1 Tax=Rubripirellula tenax TaxID=2528015 RepID=A0A5C6EKK2_9BACT|nr:hypothetical protein Poly51_49140 [Rubripirellula tenax]